MGVAIGMKKTRGRPPKADRDRRTVMFEIRLSPAEKELLDGAAGGNTSTWARDVLVRAAKRKATQA